MKCDLSGKCLIEVSGEGCDACLAVMPNCGEVAEKFGLKFVRISIEDDPEVVERYSVDRIPSIILAKDGVPFAKCSGYQPMEILELWVEAKIN